MPDTVLVVYLFVHLLLDALYFVLFLELIYDPLLGSPFSFLPEQRIGRWKLEESDRPDLVISYYVGRTHRVRVLALFFLQLKTITLIRIAFNLNVLCCRWINLWSIISVYVLTLMRYV